ncbi:iron-sulfur cluster biosynthesis family protein [Fructilactobacillus hinvesii]|uniref:Iron-sulfur cluster biosynthesis family protein n=1 Tax=Fructilactobacillus hinvesii TaxID=2940300 RepID=A0ABY5BSG1_9LACO|nr:iron-sulfur cluster biosynthesis family protein [Fructilactobacillus hinvesii]USS88045.1 iron-sulfur cluster biosynthesis family protein [Fructilactobacillus hinvesii]
MNLTITDSAMDYIKKRLPDAKYYLLATDDGSNQYSKGGGSCTVGDTFQVVGISKLESPYDVKMDNNQDAPFYTSKNDMSFFDKGMKIDFNHNWLQLKSDSELLDGQMTTNDATKGVENTGMDGVIGC